MITDQLQKLIEGRDLVRVNILGGRFRKVPPPGYEDLRRDLSIGPLRVEEVGCKGKFIYWRLEDGWSVLNTLGMTGIWSRMKDKHASFRFDYAPARSEASVFRSLFFVDRRHFGMIKFTQKESALSEKLDKLGIDLLQEDPGWEKFYQVLRSKPDQQVSKALMDQTNFAGIGNYVKSDSLYTARISPWRTVGSLTHSEVKRLYDAVREILITSYESGGNTISDYRDVNGDRGLYRCCCYGRKTDDYGNQIIRARTLDGRLTWWCPVLQI